MGLTLSSQLDAAKAALAHLGRTPADNNEALRLLNSFARKADEYKNKYKSQPKVRKAIVASGQYATELALLLRRIIDADTPGDHRVLNAAKVRAVFAVNNFSLAGFDETSLQLVEQWMHTVRELAPSPKSNEPSQLAGLFDHP